jgi:hypothetical protein
MKDFLLFRRMVTPLIIQVLFWLLIIMAIVSAVASMFHKEFLTGILTLIFGPIFIRVACEGVLVFFRINDNLTDIRQKIVSN